MKKSLGILFRSGVWIGTAVILLVCLLFARLLFAPIDLGFARDRLAAAGESFLPGWQINFSEPRIGWDWRAVRPWISIRDLRLIDRRDRMAVFVPRANVGVSFSSLLGEPGISTVELDSPQILVTDLAGFSDATTGSSFADLIGDGGVPKPEIFRPITEAFSRFTARMMEQAPGLENVRISSAMVEIARGGDFVNARLALPRMELSTQGDLLLLDALSDIQLGNRPIQLRLRGTAEPEVGELDVSLTFSEFRTSDLELQAEVPEVIGYFDIPVTVELDLELASNIGLRGARFGLTLDQGELSHPVRYPNAAPVNFGTISGYYVPAEEMISVDTILLQAGEREIAGRGVIQWMPGKDNPAVKMVVQTDEATIEDVKLYWPIATYPDGEPRGARRWVDENMISGTVRNVNFAVDWSPETGGAFDNGSAFKLTFDVRNTDTRYLRDMPAIENANGRGVLTREEFSIFLRNGFVHGMPIDGSTAFMHDIHKRGEGIGRFDIRLHGPVRDIMHVISHDPLNVPERMNFDPARLDGTARVRATVEVPLIKNAPKEDVTYSVHAELLNTRVENLLGGEGLKEGDLTLTLDSDRLSLQGEGRLNGVPVDLYWRENFKAGREDAAAETTEIVLAGNLDETDIAAFGVDISDFLDGKVTGEATFLGRNFTFSRGYFSADATGAVLKVPQLAWAKPADAPAAVNGTLVFFEGRTSLAPLVVTGEGIDLAATFNWGSREAGGFDGDFTIRELGRNRLAGTVEQSASGNTDVRIVAERFDAGAFLAELDDAPQPDEPGAIPTASQAEKAGATRLDITADQMLLLNGESLGNVALNTRFDEGEPKELAFSGSVWGTEQKMQMSIASAGEGDGFGRPISISSPDGGQLLRGLGLFAHLRNGMLEMSGQTSGWGQDLRIEGMAKIDDSLLVAKKNLGPAVEEGVVSGLEDFLSDGPVELEKIEVPFKFDDGLLDVTSLQANGPTLGMTMGGQISAREDKINVNGVFVPAYGINALLGKIPLLGTLLTGGEGKGVFGVTYRVKGQLAEPDFTINPVSGLAPGFLRLLFEGKRGKISEVETPQTPENPEDPDPGEGKADAPPGDGEGSGEAPDASGPDASEDGPAPQTQP